MPQQIIMRIFKSAALLLMLFPISCGFMAGTAANSLDLPVLRKTVTAKVEPSELVAADGSSCFVSERRFEEVKISDEVFCAWSGGSDRGLGVPTADRHDG